MRLPGIMTLFLAVPVGLYLAAYDRSELLELTSDVNLALVVDPNPPRVGPSALTIALSDASGLPIEGATVKVRGANPQVCMQPLQARLDADGEGRYAAPFVWPMGGEWTLAVTATLPNGHEVSREFSLAIGEPQAAHRAETGSGPKRIPNGGAAIRIVSPQDGETFVLGRDVRVEIESRHFDLGEDGRHWHLYVDGRSAQMIMGKTTDAVLRSLAPGQHEVSAYLSPGTHEELEEGTKVTITIAEDAEG